MKLTQMIVQGLQESKSPLLQLPHFEEEHLRYCISKKVTAICPVFFFFFSNLEKKKKMSKGFVEQWVNGSFVFFCPV